MVKAQLFLFGLMALALFLIFPCAIAKREIHKDCGLSRCGNVTVKYPFRLKSQPRQCGDYKLELECDDHNRTTLVIGKGKLYLQEISYENHTLRVMVIDHERLIRDLCSLPQSSFDIIEFESLDLSSRVYLFSSSASRDLYVVSCTTPMKSSLYVDASRCPNSSSHPPSYFYFLDGRIRSSDFNQSCTAIANVRIMLRNITGLSTMDIYEKLFQGYEMTWSYTNWNCIWCDNNASFQDM